MPRAHQHFLPSSALRLHALWLILSWMKPPTHSLLKTFCLLLSLRLRQTSLWLARLLSSFWLNYQFPREGVSFRCADRGPHHQKHMSCWHQHLQRVLVTRRFSCMLTWVGLVLFSILAHWIFFLD